MAMQQALERHRVLTDPFGSVDAPPRPEPRSRAEVLAEVVDAFRSHAAARQAVLSFGAKVAGAQAQAQTQAEVEAAKAPKQGAKDKGKDASKPSMFLLDVKEVSS